LVKSKKAIKSIYAINDAAFKGNFLKQGLDDIVKEKQAFEIISGGSSIRRHFLAFYIDPSGLVKTGTVEPFYANRLSTLENKYKYLQDISKEVYTRERDLLTGFQTEFSIYALLISVLATLIAIIALLSQLKIIQ